MKTTPTVKELQKRPNAVRITPNERKDLAQIFVDTDGMVTDHNFPCPICKSTQAVLNTTSGEFQPCWDCQSKDWHTVQIKSSLIRWFTGL